MKRRVGRWRPGQLLGWLLVSRPPRSRADHALLVSLPLLALLTALLLTWPWLSSEAPRLLAAGLEALRAALLEWSQRLLDGAQRLLGPLAGGEP